MKRNRIFLSKKRPSLFPFPNFSYKTMDTPVLGLNRGNLRPNSAPGPLRNPWCYELEQFLTKKPPFLLFFPTGPAKNGPMNQNTFLEHKPPPLSLFSLRPTAHSSMNRDSF